ncbi:MAG TPA: cytochrome P450 [Candidatus Binataceae bacterium]|nr:cytochrome P450 [Candidatus Binataceae bacterium]
MAPDRSPDQSAGAARAARPLRGDTPPGPRGHLLLGSLREVQREPLELMRAGFREYGDVVRYRFVATRAFLLAHPDHIRHVLHDNHRNYDKHNVDYAMLRRLLGNGLLTSDGAFWYRQRRLMAPMFHRQRVAGFSSLMVDSTLEMLERWDALERSGAPFDVATEMARLTLAIVAKALFSADVSDDAEVIGAALTEVNRQLGEFSLLDMFRMIPTPRKRRFRAAVSALDQVVGKIVDQRRRTAQRNEDLLSMLLDAVDEETSEGMTPRQVRDEVLTLMLAGHETTANALAWTWYLLSQNPEAEKKLHRELSGVLGERKPDGLDLPRLPYTRMVIEESMRLYPPAWAISRNAIGDDEIGGYRVPRKTNIIICSFVTHRHPAFWDEPERFDPERFSPERSEGRPNFAYLPFGGGPRICIGNGFAMAEAQLVVATVAQRYRLRLAPGHPVELQPLITLRPRHGMRMTLHRAGAADTGDRAAADETPPARATR